VLVWLNGRWLRAQDARVPALDRGLLHGDGLYDTWRTYDGVPFAVAAHIRRLTAAARVLRLPSPGPAALWEGLSRQIAARNGVRDAAVRLTFTRGAAGELLVPERATPPTRLLTIRPLAPDLAQTQALGIGVLLLPFPRDAAPPWGSLKLVGKASGVVGRMLAQRRGAQEALYVTADGAVTEATNGALLGGVTRDLVVRLARRVGIVVREERVTVARLRRAAEVFITASTVEVLPVVLLDGRRVGAGRPGPITLALQERYRAAVSATLARARIAASR